MPEDRNILIAGAGIGGLAASLFLARKGFLVTICDRELELKEFGAGVQLSPNATRLLTSIGILDDLDHIAVEPERLVIHNGRDGKIITQARMGEHALARFGAPFLSVHRADLQKALLERARRESQITLKLGLRLADMRETEDDITGIFETDSEEHERVSADLMIGADGLWSRARKLAGLPGPSRYTGKTAWRTLIPRQECPLFAREPEVNLWLGPSAHIVHYPVCGGRDINVVVIIDDPWREEGWLAAGNPDILLSHLSTWHKKPRELVSAADHWARWALIDRPPESRWSRPRMTLLGDAAHPMVPFLAQGASQAIEDASVLADALSAQPNTAGGIRAGFATYERLRIGRTSRIQKEARRQGDIYQLTGLPARIRNLALATLPQDKLLERFAWIYDHGREQTPG